MQIECDKHATRLNSECVIFIIRMGKEHTISHSSLVRQIFVRSDCRCTIRFFGFLGDGGVVNGTIRCPSGVRRESSSNPWYSRTPDGGIIVDGGVKGSSTIVFSRVGDDNEAVEDTDGANDVTNNISVVYQGWFGDKGTTVAHTLDAQRVYQQHYVPFLATNQDGKNQPSPI